MPPAYRRLWSEPYPNAIVRKWMLMAFISGNVNAGGLMACNRFVTHVTGFATMFGMEAANGNFRLALGMLSVPFYFLLGVMGGAFFTDTAITRGRKPRFGLVMGTVAGALVLAAVCGYFAVFGLFGTTFQLEQDYPLLVLLSLASGLQNAALTTASGAIVRSTHMTGTTTDLGIGLMRVLFARSQPTVRQREFSRNWLRLGTILGFILGSLVGAVLFNFVEYLGFLLPAGLSLYVGNLGVVDVPVLKPVEVSAQGGDLGRRGLP